MNQNSKLIPAIIAVGGFALVIGAICFFMGFSWEKQPEEPDLGVVSYNDGKKVINLVGTGETWVNSESLWSPTYPTTTPGTGTTIYQFNSSTDETYWMTNEFPANLHGATTTSYFSLGEADMWSLGGYFHASRTASQLAVNLAASDSDSCDNASTTVNSAIWYPLPESATTTDLISAGVGISSTTVTLIPGAIGVYTFSVPFKDVNYRCVRAKAYNSSTTDPSLLHLWAIVRDK